MRYISLALLLIAAIAMAQPARGRLAMATLGGNGVLSVRFLDGPPVDAAAQYELSAKATTTWLCLRATDNACPAAPGLRSVSSTELLTSSTLKPLPDSAANVAAGTAGLISSTLSLGPPELDEDDFDACPDGQQWALGEVVYERITLRKTADKEGTVLQPQRLGVRYHYCVE